MATKKHTIQVRQYAEKQTQWGNENLGRIMGNFGKFEVKETINRVLRAGAIGNFNPIFCTYKGKQYLVSSEEGDLSDPFRATEEYLKTLFIAVPA